LFIKGTIKVKILDPIETTGLVSADVSDLTIKIHDKMQNVFNELNAQLKVSKSNILDSQTIDNDKNM
jgi:hypothetical protein